MVKIAIVGVVFLFAQIVGVSGHRKVFAPSTHTFSMLHTNNDSGACSGASCTAAMTSSTARSVLMVFGWTSSNIHLTAVSGCSATWTTGTTSNYNLYNSSSGGMYAAYALNVAAGCTSVSLTMNASNSGSWDAVVDEFGVSGSASPVVLDALSSTTTSTTSCSTCTGAAFTGLTGTNDLIVEPIDWQNVPTPSSPYVWDATDGAAYALNYTSGTAPTFTSSAGYFQAMGFAFK